MRAAFKAIQDGKQVAVLVPTTCWCSSTSRRSPERYAQFPVVVKRCSRASRATRRHARSSRASPTAASTSSSARTACCPRTSGKDLGLVVVDEEQRFGVEHKEQLKTLRTAVDVLAMSATPIPRTLEMAVTGIREMSTLATPPEERHPV